MREALSALTLRGRAFLAAGVTAVACAIVLGQPMLTRVGILLTAVPLITAAVVGQGRYRLALVRTVSPDLVAAGQAARVQLALTNEGRTPTGVLLLEDQVPYVLGTRPRFVLEGIGHGWRRHVTYQVRSDVRGRFEIGPMTVRVSDPFGMVEYTRAFTSTSTLTVTPQVLPLSGIPIGGAWTGSGDNRPRAFATGSAEDVTVREYRRGDDLRRVHWRSSARMGELMVRREEQPWQSRATIFLDNRVSSHRGHGSASTFEVAVIAAASIGLHLVHRGFLVRLVTASGEADATKWHVRDEETNRRTLLDSLAVLTLTDRAHLESGWLVESARSGVVIGVLGNINVVDHSVLRRMAAHATSALAVALQADAWAVGPDYRNVSPVAAAELGALGWRAVNLRPADRLPAVWEQLGRTGGPVSAPSGWSGRR